MSLLQTQHFSLQQPKKNGIVHASYEYAGDDSFLDYVVKVDTQLIASSDEVGEQEIFAFATTNGDEDLLFSAPSEMFI